MTDKISESLDGILGSLNSDTYNIILGIGSSQLTDLSYYKSLIKQSNPSLSTIILLFSKTEDFPQNTLNLFTKKNEYLESRYYIKDKIHLFIVPHYLPREEHPELENLSLYMTKIFQLTDEGNIGDIGRYYTKTDYSLSDRIQLNCRGDKKSVFKLNLNHYIKSFLSKNYMKTLTNFCYHNLTRGSQVHLVNNFNFNDKPKFNFCGNQLSLPRGMTSYMIGNEYFTYIPYLYPLINILSEFSTFKFHIQNDTSNTVSNLKRVINTITNPRFFDINLKDDDKT